MTWGRLPSHGSGTNPTRAQARTIEVGPGSHRLASDRLGGPDKSPGHGPAAVATWWEGFADAKGDLLPGAVRGIDSGLRTFTSGRRHYRAPSGRSGEVGLWIRQGPTSPVANLALRIRCITALSCGGFKVHPPSDASNYAFEHGSFSEKGNFLRAIDVCETAERTTRSGPGALRAGGANDGSDDSARSPLLPSTDHAASALSLAWGRESGPKGEKPEHRPRVVAVVVPPGVLVQVSLQELGGNRVMRPANHMAWNHNRREVEDLWKIVPAVGCT